MRLLRYSADRRTLAVVFAWYVVEVLLFCVDVHHVACVLLLFVLSCAGSFLAAVAAHNASHCPVFRRRSLESAWRCILTVAYGHPVGAFVPGHNLSHHRHLERLADVMRTSKARARWNLLNALLFAPRISADMWRAEFGYLCFAWNRRARWRRQTLVEALVLVVALGALAVLDWKRLLGFVLLPHAYAAWGIVTMNLLQHDGTEPASAYNHSRSFVGGVVNWLTFNNGYHAVHHERPGLHWSLTPAAHERLLAPHVDPRLVEPSLPAYLFRTFVLPGRRVRFDGRPVEVMAPGLDAPWYGQSS